MRRRLVFLLAVLLPLTCGCGYLFSPWPCYQRQDNMTAWYGPDGELVALEEVHDGVRYEDRALLKARTDGGVDKGDNYACRPMLDWSPDAWHRARVALRADPKQCLKGPNGDLLCPTPLVEWIGIKALYR